MVWTAAPLDAVLALNRQRNTASDAGPAAQRSLVVQAWTALGNAYHGAGANPLADADYQRVMGAAYGPIARWSQTMSVPGAINSGRCWPDLVNSGRF